MITLQSSGSSQTFSFIPRSYTAGLTYTINITNETTNKQVYTSTATSFTAEDYFYKHTDTFTLVEDTMYTLEIKQGSDVVYKDKIFCTNQTATSYSVNNSAYTEHSQDNEFIVL
jgi:hypothetical protein